MKQYSAILAVLAIGLTSSPALAQADNPAGAPMNQSARASATAEEKGLISTELRPRFRTYVVQQAPASFTYSSPVAVGTVLPETGVTYYDVPAEFGTTQYRYTVVNNSPVLVEPRTRRVVQVIQ
jgi:Protein of unknown function (DUF1236)